MNAQLLDEFAAFVELCASLRGQQLRIDEAISTNGLNFDRHFTTFGTFALTLTTSYCRLSGGRLTLHGENQLYEIGGDQLASFTRHGAQCFELIERYSATVFRRTTIQLPDGAIPDFV